MILGLDYDGTYKRDPAFWCGVASFAKAAGHTMICVTGRKEPPGLLSGEPPLPPGVRCICAPNGRKREFAALAGFLVDVWIDDMPELIGPARILDWSQP